MRTYIPFNLGRNYMHRSYSFSLARTLPFPPLHPHTITRVRTHTLSSPRPCTLQRLTQTHIHTSYGRTTYARAVHLPEAGAWCVVRLLGFRKCRTRGTAISDFFLFVFILCLVFGENTNIPTAHPLVPCVMLVVMYVFIYPACIVLVFDRISYIFPRACGSALLQKDIPRISLHHRPA